MTLKELCRELNSPYASYAENVFYYTAFPVNVPFSSCLLLNQAAADHLDTRIARQSLEIRHGSEKVQVADLGGTVRLAYSGNTKAMKTTIKQFGFSKYRMSASLGERVFEQVEKDLERTQAGKAHFEYEIGTGTATRVIFILKKLISVYEAQDKLLDILKKIAEKKTESC